MCSSLSTYSSSITHYSRVGNEWTHSVLSVVIIVGISSQAIGCLPQFLMGQQYCLGIQSEALHHATPRQLRGSIRRSRRTRGVSRTRSESVGGRDHRVAVMPSSTRRPLKVQVGQQQSEENSEDAPAISARRAWRVRWSIICYDIFRVLSAGLGK